MNATQSLHALGQSLWLDQITRDLLNNGTLARYIRDLSVTGLTSNPTIFDKAISDSHSYDDAIRNLALAGESGEALFFNLALEDLGQAADMFRPVHEATDGIDGWVSLEVSPLIANDTAATVGSAGQLHARMRRPNVLIKIPGTQAGISAIEQVIFAGIPVNVTLLFSSEQYVAAAEAYMRGLERRVAAGLDARVGSVASIFVSRWDVAIKDRVPAELRNRLGIAIAMQTYQAYRALLAGARWQKLAAAGARPQRVLWASTGTKDKAARDVLYVEALAAPDTVNTMPEQTLLAFADHGKVQGVLSETAGGGAAVLADFSRQGIDTAALAAQLQREGAEAFATSWRDLMSSIAAKSAQTVSRAAQQR
jgi:transaldolase